MFAIIESKQGSNPMVCAAIILQLAFCVCVNAVTLKYKNGSGFPCHFLIKSD